MSVDRWLVARWWDRDRFELTYTGHPPEDARGVYRTTGVRFLRVIPYVPDPRLPEWWCRWASGGAWLLVAAPCRRVARERAYCALTGLDGTPPARFGRSRTWRDVRARRATDADRAVWEQRLVAVDDLAATMAPDDQPALFPSPAVREETP